MFYMESHGDWSKTFKFLHKASNLKIKRILDKYGQMGVEALQDATPVRTGLTAQSWSYSLSEGGERYEIQFSNSNVNKGVNIALIIQLGHGTGTGGYVSGIDYINPAIEPVFKEMADAVFKEVSEA